MRIIAETAARAMKETRAPSPGAPQLAADFWTSIAEMDATLAGDAARAIDEWVGGRHDAVAQGLEGGLMIPGRLEGMSDQALDTMAAPMRQALRVSYGQMVTVYRGEVADGSQSTGRKNRLVSYSMDRAVAERFAGVSQVHPLISEQLILAAEKELGSTGSTRVGGYELRKEDGAIWLYRHGQAVTDTEGVRAEAERQNAYAAEQNAHRSHALKNVREVQIPVEAVVWATDRFHQKEVIARVGREIQAGGPPQVTKNGAGNQSRRAHVSVARDQMRAAALDADGNEIGFVSGTIKGDTLVIGKSTLQVQLQGNGHGLAMYQALVDEALGKGLKVASANEVSDSASRMYRALEKRGYAVDALPYRIEEASGGRRIVQTDNMTRAPFIITGKPRDHGTGDASLGEGTPPPDIRDVINGPARTASSGYVPDKVSTTSFLEDLAGVLGKLIDKQADAVQTEGPQSDQQTKQQKPRIAR